jgi:hypothetical protein
VKALELPPPPTRAKLLIHRRDKSMFDPTIDIVTEGKHKATLAEPDGI